MNKTEAWYAQTEPAIRRRIDEGFTDDEIIVEMRAMGAVAPWERQHAATYVAEVRRRYAPGSVRRRAAALPDPAGSLDAALLALDKRDGRLTKQNVATEMGIDRGTLTGYIDRGEVPSYPWEAYLGQLKAQNQH